MDKNRIRGILDRTSGRKAVKSISIKAPGCKSGGCVPKAVELTAGDLSCVAKRLRTSRGALTARQKSAEGILGRCSRSTRLGHSPERGETAGLAGPGTIC